MAALLPRLFFDHFHTTSFAAVDGNEDIVGFLVGFLSPQTPRRPTSTSSVSIPGSGVRASGVASTTSSPSLRPPTAAPASTR